MLNQYINRYKKTDMTITSFFVCFFLVRDASGKLGSGIYNGNRAWFGSFSECKKLPESRYCLVIFDALVLLNKQWEKVCIFIMNATIMCESPLLAVVYWKKIIFILLLNYPKWIELNWIGLEWSGMEWSEVEWGGVEWSGVEWSGQIQ